MAYQMSYTDPQTGETYPASVWMPLNILPVLHPRRYGLVTFAGFATPEAAAVALASALAGRGTTGRHVGLKDYRVYPQQLREVMLRLDTGADYRTALAAVAYEVQAGTDDVPDPTAEEPNRRRNFFAPATWVAVRPG